MKFFINRILDREAIAEYEAKVKELRKQVDDMVKSIQQDFSLSIEKM